MPRCEVKNASSQSLYLNFSGGRTLKIRARERLQVEEADLESPAMLFHIARGNLVVVQRTPVVAASAPSAPFAPGTPPGPWVHRDAAPSLWPERPAEPQATSPESAETEPADRRRRGRRRADDDKGAR